MLFLPLSLSVSMTLKKVTFIFVVMEYNLLEIIGQSLGSVCMSHSSVFQNKTVMYLSLLVAFFMTVKKLCGSPHSSPH